MKTAKILPIVVMFLITGVLDACTEPLEIQQEYPFTISAMPVQKSIALGETAEIRLKIIREGIYKDTKYYIRYFQPDGEGEVKLSNGTVLLPNDLYELSSDVFRIYYTSASMDQQQIDIYIEDSFGQTEQLSFRFSNKRVDD